MAARLGMIVFDTPDPVGLAGFWRDLLGWEVDPAWSSEDWVTIRGDGASPIGFQLAPDLPAPTWPSPDVSQQAHLDVYVADVDEVAARALELGATALDVSDDHCKVLADPTGHPFCVCKDPEAGP